MRVAYALGAVTAIVEARSELPIRSFSCSSASTVAALGYHSKDISSFSDEVFRRLATRRFINPARFWRISDIDYLVDDVVMPMVDADRLDDPSAPEIWVSLTDARTALHHYERLTSSNVRTLLRATMAIPVLYGKRVEFLGNEYVDGGIADALPLFHALSLSEEGEAVLPLATKPISALASHDIGFVERLILTLDPRVSASVRHLLLAPNPLVKLTIEAFGKEALAGVSIWACEPSNTALSFSRTNTDVSRLEELYLLGTKDVASLMAHKRDLRQYG